MLLQLKRAPEVGLLNHAAGEGEAAAAAAAGINTSCEVPVLLRWSLRHSPAKHLVRKQMYIEGIGVEENYNVLSPREAVPH